MNTIVRKEIEELILGGRRKTVKEFDLMLEKYLQSKTEDDKGEIGEALADFYSDRIRQFVKVENELALLRQSGKVNKPIKRVRKGVLA
jgi:hypothetical protein